MTRWLLLSSLFLLGGASAHGDSQGNGFKFFGYETWPVNYRDLCDGIIKNEHHENSSLYCAVFFMDYSWIKVEVLDLEIPLVVFRDLLEDSSVNTMVEVITAAELKKQSVVGVVNSPSRQANGSWFRRNANNATEAIFTRVDRAMPNVEIRSSEDFSALSYHPGGHYSPHHDFLTYFSDSEYDYWMKNFGNRYATLIVVLQPAEKGGGTVFPHTNTTVRPNKGDAFFWLNMNEFQGMKDRSLHGGCPIYEGQKLILTMWIRIRDQPLLLQCRPDGSLSLDLLLKPSYSQQRNYYEVPREDYKSQPVQSKLEKQTVVSSVSPK
ncbi:unnamed protein product [Caenorhabditis auriculariae]|uniref:Fe2OG dioxygenase domain-containing protein n=1 Tax=Caenorhabditis auriculariae TaxID=2777116 RepID=A0A8S1GUZ2_9PELO|nr:unnamed protein product [Caenorhabditis auriculariae]